MKFDAVLFDLDGTLLDTIEDLADSMNTVLEGLHLPTHDVPAYKIFVGAGVENLVRRALPADQISNEMVGRCVAAMSDEYRRRWRNNTIPYDGIPQLLDAISDHGVRMAVLSNKPHEFTQLCVSELLADWDFAVVQGVTDGVAEKPDPTGAIAISRLLEIAPSNFLYLGDTDTDMQTASAAGMYAVGALWGFRTPEELLETGAQTLVEYPPDVLALLDHQR